FERRLDRGGDQRYVAVTGEQPLDLLQADLAAAHDHAAPAGQLQAGDVEGRVEHPLDAALIADPPAQLTDALLACVSLCGHGSSVAATGPCAGLVRVRRKGPPGALSPWAFPVRGPAPPRAPVRALRCAMPRGAAA